MVQRREIYVNGRLSQYTNATELELIIRREKRCAQRGNSPNRPKRIDKKKLA
jgi:hypothetical protein